MVIKKELENMPADKKDLSLRVFNLIIGRVLKRVYLDFDEMVEEGVKDILGDAKSDKMDKISMPDFKKIFNEEAEKIEKEIKDEIENQFKS